MNSALLPIFIAFTPFFVILLVRAMRPERWCPTCIGRSGRDLLPFRRTWRQWLEGGFVCAKCGCDIDVDGKIAPASHHPRLSSVLKVMLMIALASLPGALLVFCALRR